MIDILRMISREKTLIDQELETENERLAFYRNFFGKNSCVTINDAIKANHSDLAVSIILHMEPSLSVDEVKEAVYGNRDIFENLNMESIGELVKLVDSLANDREIYKKIKKKLGKGVSFSDIFSKEGQLAIMIQHLTDTMDTTPEKFFCFVDTFIDNSNAFVYALSTVATLREIKEEKEMHYSMIKEISEEEGAKIKGKVQDKWVAEMIRGDYNISNLLKPIAEARGEYQRLEQEQRNRRRYLSRTKIVYDTLETNLYNAIQAGEVRNIDSLIKKIPSDEIRMAILKFVYTHNQSIYKELTKEYEQLAANDASHYQVLLAKYGISPEIYEVGTVMENSIEDLEKMLSLLTKLKFTTPEQLLSIVQTSNLETVQNIQGLTERGIITGTLLSNHKNIFNPASAEYEDFMRNLSLINKKKLNPHYFTETEEVFVLPHEELEQSLKTLEEYELLSSIRNGMNLSFLNNKELSASIDTLLELGYERNLEESLELLNYSDKFDRLRVLKALNIPVTDTASLLEVLTTDKFYVPDSEIENYLYNAVEHKIPKNIVLTEEPKKKVSDITKLSQFSKTSRTYEFNGVLVSKNKVHRNLSHVAATGKPSERLIYGALKGSVLSDEEVLKVVAALAPQKTTKAAKTK